MTWRFFHRLAAKPLSSQTNIAAYLNSLWDENNTSSSNLPDLIGRTGYTLPDLKQAVVLPIGAKGSQNYLVFTDKLPSYLPTSIHIDNGCNGNVIVFGKNEQFPDDVHFQGNDCLMIWGSNIPWRANVNVRFSSSRELFFWGAGSTSNGTTVILEGEQRSVIVGEDCMFALNTTIMTSDLHSIVDLKLGAWQNPPADVVIEPHVWVGQDALILKGATIGRGSIVGAKSLVTKAVLPASLAVGIPARTIRECVSWDRGRSPTKEAVQSLQKLLGEFL